MSKELPKYVCHKEVHALQIKAVDRRDGKYFIVPVEEGYEPIEVEAAWIDKHGPVRGGYLVIYKDGYRSFSPRRAFEEGYTAAYT
ncbi:MAG TPA: hypothetical protein VLH80_07335 [Nitrospiraceae bacterium]|nr:hypothetical protein [Nitrospiraceae bacterium]